MKNNIPQGSKIIVDHLNGFQRIVIPYDDGGMIKYFIGAFLLIWMGGWLVGFISALSQVLSGKAGMFLIIWLCAWSIGGFFAGYMIYRVFRKSVSEQLLFNRPSLSIDTGIPPIKINFNSQKDYWKSLLHKRKKIEFNSSEVKTLTLRETDGGNRLTIDKGKERFELATSGSEIEREWLYNFISGNYS